MAGLLERLGLGSRTRSSSETASRSSGPATRRCGSRMATTSSSPGPWPAAERSRLYLVTGARPSLAAFLEAAVRGGVDLVQLREKGLPDGELLPVLEEARAVTRRLGVPLVVNDRPDLAVLVGADGVHVGQNDLPLAAARRFGLPVGQSTHAPDELARAEADYLGVGPVFATPTKEGRPAVGLELRPPRRRPCAGPLVRDRRDRRGERRRTSSRREPAASRSSARSATRPTPSGRRARSGAPWATDTYLGVKAEEDVADRVDVGTPPAPRRWSPRSRSSRRRRGRRRRNSPSAIGSNVPGPMARRTTASGGTDTVTARAGRTSQPFSSRMTRLTRMRIRWGSTSSTVLTPCRRHACSGVEGFGSRAGIEVLARSAEVPVRGDRPPAVGVHLEVQVRHDPVRVAGVAHVGNQLARRAPTGGARARARTRSCSCSRPGCRFGACESLFRWMYM